MFVTRENKKEKPMKSAFGNPLLDIVAFIAAIAIIASYNGHGDDLAVAVSVAGLLVVAVSVAWRSNY